MNHLNAWGLDSATDNSHIHEAERIVDLALLQIRQPLIDVVSSFFKKPLSPLVVAAFELAIQGIVRELGRLLLEHAFNALEPDCPDKLPKNLSLSYEGYRRRNQKTANRHVASRFGNIVLRRYGYRSWQPGGGSIFPLEMLLGLNHSVTPALVDWIGRHMADAGANQAAVIDQLRTDCDVTMGVKRLRQCTQQLSESMEEFRQKNQVERLLEALEKAYHSSGSRKPVLAVGRDGITLREYAHRAFQVATAATVSVYNRQGKRLITVYLAYPPERGQATMDQMLTDLLTELLGRYHHPLPRLAYVTDSGSNETSYYKNVLRQMVHPRTGKRLEWTRVADYYHASERIWTMAEVLFGKGTQEANAWAHRMLKLLNKPSGPRRVLHSAANYFSRRQRESKKLSLKEEAIYRTAYRYIQKRTKLMRYSDFRSLHIPLGSGVTEAACKTVFTQRLKCSGMRWSHDGAKTILVLRTILLSKSWALTYDDVLKNAYPDNLRPYKEKQQNNQKIAA